MKIMIRVGENRYRSLPVYQITSELLFMYLCTNSLYSRWMTV